MSGILTNQERATIIDAHNAITSIETQIAALRENIKTHRAAVEALGIRMTDFNYARKFCQLEEDDRAKAQRSRLMAWEALDLNAEPTLFDAPLGKDDVSSPTPTFAPPAADFDPPPQPKRGPGRPKKTAAPVEESPAPDADGNVTVFQPGAAYEDGRQAYRDHVAVNDCPHPAGSIHNGLWTQGWLSEQAAVAAALFLDDAGEASS